LTLPSLLSDLGHWLTKPLLLGLQGRRIQSLLQVVPHKKLPKRSVR